MDQIKIGNFLKQLRNENQYTQAQIAEQLGVSNRSVSRWENGVNLPDFDLLLQISSFYKVSIEEILDGERKEALQNENTLRKVMDYSTLEKNEFTKRVRSLFIIGLLCQILLILLLYFEINDQVPFLSGLLSGVTSGVLIIGILLTTKYMSKIRNAKLKLLHRNA